MAGFANDANLKEIVYCDNVDFSGGTHPTGQITSNGQLLIGSASSPNIRAGSITSPDGSITFGYSSPNITAVVTGGAPYISLSPYIVGADNHSGFTTIGAAIAQAVSDGASATNPKNIYVKPKNGGYTENLTLTDGINIIGFSHETKIIGKLTMTAAGTASVNNLQLVTNSDYVLEITGSAASIVWLNNCFINANNNSTIHHTSSNASSLILITNCRADTGTTGVAYFVSTSAGAIKWANCYFDNTGNSSTASTYSGAGGINFYNTFFFGAITTSGTGGFTGISSQFYMTNSSLTLGASGTNQVSNCVISGGTASALSCGGTVTCTNCAVDSTNANAITGGGTLKYGMIVFTNTSSTVNTTTQTALATLI